jgi:AraC-like DNA-binding protein
MTAPWHRTRPSGAVDVATDDDDFVTVDKWPREVFRPHYHDKEFNWLVPLRAGRMVVMVDGDELTIDGEHWLCVFPRVPHAVVHVSDDCEVLSLFVPSPVMEAAWDVAKPPLGRPAIVGGESTIAHGLALAWARHRCARETGPLVAALGSYIAGWMWRHYTQPVADDLGVKLRSGLPDGSTIAAFFERHLADQPFPWRALADALALSTRTLQRQFVAAIGHAPSQVLQQLRLERARDLLRDPARPIGDIALACGFASQAHFATVFRAAYGRSPSAYRKGDG